MKLKTKAILLINMSLALFPLNDILYTKKFPIEFHFLFDILQWKQMPTS